MFHPSNRELHQLMTRTEHQILRICERYVSTVLTLIFNSLDISMDVLARPIHVRISNSLSVSRSMGDKDTFDLLGLRLKRSSS